MVGTRRGRLLQRLVGQPVTETSSLRSISERCVVGHGCPAARSGEENGARKKAGRGAVNLNSWTWRPGGPLAPRSAASASGGNGRRANLAFCVGRWKRLRLVLEISGGKMERR
jgi:hypothetical protein